MGTQPSTQGTAKDTAWADERAETVYSVPQLSLLAQAYKFSIQEAGSGGRPLIQCRPRLYSSRPTWATG